MLVYMCVYVFYFEFHDIYEGKIVESQVLENL